MGLRDAVGWLLTTLAEDPARALFCYVEIIKGGRPLVRLREQVRPRLGRHLDRAVPRDRAR